MSTINRILIKRRLESSQYNNVPSLSGGELAFSEKNHTLYYGGQYGTLAIAGSGAFVNLEGPQTIAGYKTLTGLTTLSSVTFSPNSLIDFGSNVLTNLSAPLAASDATTRQYVDDAISNLANSGGSATTSLSTEIYENFTRLTENRAVDLSGGLTVTGGASIDTISTTGNASIGGNLVVTGDLQVLGEFTTLETTTTLTSSFSIENAGGITALVVNQTGSTDIAEFKDDGSTALIIKDGGNVGVGISTPNEKLTVSGNISASNNIYAGGSLEVYGGGINTTLYVEDGKVGVNTETPNEALTVFGNISASGNLTIGCFSVDNLGNIDTCGTLTVGGDTVLNSTLEVGGVATFGSTVSAVNGIVTDPITLNYFDGDIIFGIKDATKEINILNNLINQPVPGGIFSFGNGTISNGGGDNNSVYFHGSLIHNPYYPDNNKIEGFVIDGGDF